MDGSLLERSATVSIGSQKLEGAAHALVVLGSNPSLKIDGSEVTVISTSSEILATPSSAESRFLTVEQHTVSRP